MPRSEGGEALNPDLIRPDHITALTWIEGQLPETRPLFTRCIWMMAGKTAEL